MSGEESSEEEHYSSCAKKGDLVICLDTGSIGVILEERTTEWVVSFPYGTFVLDSEDFDVLKSGRT